MIICLKPKNMFLMFKKHILREKIERIIKVLVGNVLDERKHTSMSSLILLHKNIGYDCESGLDKTNQSE